MRGGILLAALALSQLTLAQAPPVPSTSSTAAQATATPADSPLKALMDGTTLKYSSSASGLSYTVLFDHPNNRKQTVFVALKPGLPDPAIAVHTIYTTVWVGKEPPPLEVMRKAFLATKKMGYFYLFEDKKSLWAIRFGVNVVAGPATPEAVAGIKDRIFFVNQVGEETDLALNGANDLK